MAILGREIDRLNMTSFSGSGLNPKQTEQLVAYLKAIPVLHKAEKDAMSEESDDLSKYSIEQLLEMAEKVSKKTKE